MRRFFTLGSVVRASVPWAIGLACSLVFVGTLAAQFPAPNSKLKSLQTGVATDLREKNFAALDIAQFDSFFNDYLLLLLADPDAKPPLDLPTVRSALRSRFFGLGKSGEPYARLVRLSFDMMNKIIKQNFPDEPKYDAVKMFAMLVIGDLNEQEGEIGGKPKPYAPAMQYMLSVVNDPKQPDFLRIPAMLGIHRQAESFADFPPNAETRREIAVSMLKIVKQQSPPPNRDAEAHAWVRRMALQNLATMGAPGAVGPADVVDAFAGVIGDDQNSLALRCAAAASLSDLKLTGVPGVNVIELCNQLGGIAATLERRELDWAEENEEEPNIRRLKSGGGGIVYTLVGRDGKHGLLALAPEPRRAGIEDMAKKINEVCGSKVSALSAEDLETKLLALEKMIKPPKVAAPVPAPSAVAPKAEKPKTGSRKTATSVDSGPLARAKAAP